MSPKVKTSPMAFASGTRLGPYAITAQIGEGGMGLMLSAGIDSRDSWAPGSSSSYTSNWRRNLTMPV